MSIRSFSSNSSICLLGIDTGGTFTDFVLLQGDSLKIHKCLSTPHAPEQAILQGIKALGLDSPALDSPALDSLALDPLAGDDHYYIVHGSTVATNAILEGKGVPVVFITNTGFADMLSIGRQTRAELYNLQPQPKPVPVPKAFCLETGGRIRADGSVVDRLNESDIELLLKQIERLQQHDDAAQKPAKAVAINLLFSYVDSQFEIEIENHIRERFPELFISRSSDILPEYKEYERGMTTWLNSYVGPLVARYLQKLCSTLTNASISVMQSSGGTIAAEQAGKHAVHMVLSGPAGGLAAAKYIGQLCDQTRLLTFDMGGTSTDVAMIDGELALSNEGMIGPYPVAIPMVDMHTIGAGGGSIASIDAGGLLKVGPESAGADPGPACYGRGGFEATVTDANLLLGRLSEDAFLGGGMRLDREAAMVAIQKLAEALHLSLQQTALGIVQIANEHMAQALRVMSIQRGIDPRALSLVSFGGAGGLHVCALAEALEMQHAIVPIHGGVLSALGMLVAPKSRRLSQTINQALAACDEEKLRQHFIRLEAEGSAALIAEGATESNIKIEYSVDLRYQGQAYYINVPWQVTDKMSARAGDASEASDASASVFHQQHKKRYGHALDVALELVNIRVAVSCASAQLKLSPVANNKPRSSKTKHHTTSDQSVAIIERESLAVGEEITGPVLITEMVATTYVAEDWRIKIDSVGNIILSREQP